MKFPFTGVPVGRGGNKLAAVVVEIKCRRAVANKVTNLMSYMQIKNKHRNTN